MSIKTLISKVRRIIIMIVHCFLIISSYILAFYLRFDFHIDESSWHTIQTTILFLICVKMILLGYHRLFSGLWKYVGIEDVWRIAKANFLATVLFIAGVTFFYRSVPLHRSIIILDCILSFSLMTGIRFVVRLFREKFRPMSRKKMKRVLVVGAGEAGVLVLREARYNVNANIEIIGFVDDNPHKKNLRIQGIKILGSRHDIPLLVEKYEIDEIVIAIPSASGVLIRDIVAHCQIPSVKIRVVPGLQKILSGEEEVKPRPIKPDDLLGRETVKINETEISKYLTNKVVLVTGAGGSIGTALCTQIARFNPKEIILFDHNENEVYFLMIDFLTKYPTVKFRTVIGDIKDIGLLKHTFSLYRPHFVFHAAAHKHVPLLEENPVAAVKNNVLGTANLIYAAHHYKAERFILISTDKAVNPSSVMGETKRVAEMLLQAKSQKSRTKFMAVRFGNVLGSAGSIVPLFMRQIEKGGPLTVTHPDAMRYFMSVNEAVLLVLQASVIGHGGEVFILDMGEQIKIVDLAKDLIILSGFIPEKDIKISFIGLRPGEKLQEELFLNKERDTATQYDKIFVAQPDTFNIFSLRKNIRKLLLYARNYDCVKMRQTLKEIIQETI
jgi:FlaA1/EpsC-like NDP-sugar epimerase